MVGWCTISIVCALIHPAYDLVVQYMNFGFACVGCPSLITLPTNCSIAQYFLLYMLFSKASFLPPLLNVIYSMVMKW